MMKAMCGQKVVHRKTTEEHMDMFGLRKTIDRLSTANRVRGYGHVLRRDDNSDLRVAVCCCWLLRRNAHLMCSGFLLNVKLN